MGVKMKKTVLLLSRGGDISGEQRQLLYLIRGLDRERFNPVVLCCRGGQFQRELSELGVHCYVYPLSGWRKVKNLFRRYRDLAYVHELIEKEGADLVHCSDVWFSQYALRGGEKASVPVLLHVRAPLSRQKAKKFRCSDAACLLAISKRVQRRLVEEASLSEDKIVLIHDAVDADLFKPLDADAGVYGIRKDYDTQGCVLVGLVGRVETEQTSPVLCQDRPSGSEPSPTGYVFHYRGDQGQGLCRTDQTLSARPRLGRARPSDRTA